MRPEISQAVELLQRNDPASLERALALLQETVFSFSMKVCGQREDAEDTMQEVLLKSVPYLPRFSSPQALSVWLYKVAKNRCLMSRRKSKFAPQRELALDELMPDRQQLESLAGGGNSESPETSALRGERAQWLRDATLRLPPAYRLVLVLHDMEELSDQEIAKITGLRPGTVRVRLHRARLYLRNELARRGAFHAGSGHVKPRLAAEEKPHRCRELFAALSDYLDEKLDDSMCEKMEAHMGDCRPCQAFLATLEQTIAECRKTPSACPDRRKAETIRRALLSQFQKPARRKTRP
ncbi:MAG TPA: sigma-70 family RNA polymerase sigma factor [Terriglobales bacterium]|nr:sigma-70 family RNA polymerase sigma factor [Terriglobales bacterium]